jgi:hypothetical protein
VGQGLGNAVIQLLAILFVIGLGCVAVVVAVLIFRELLRGTNGRGQIGIKHCLLLAVVFAVTVALVGHVGTPVVSVVAGGAFLGLLGCVCAVEFLKGDQRRAKTVRSPQTWRVWRIYRRSQHEKAADTVVVKARE